MYNRELSDQTATLRQTLEYVNLTLDVFGRLRLALRDNLLGFGLRSGGPRGTFLTNHLSQSVRVCVRHRGSSV